LLFGGFSSHPIKGFSIDFTSHETQTAKLKYKGEMFVLTYLDGVIYGYDMHMLIPTYMLYIWRKQGASVVMMQVSICSTPWSSCFVIFFINDVIWCHCYKRQRQQTTTMHRISYLTAASVCHCISLPVSRECWRLHYTKLYL